MSIVSKVKHTFKEYILDSIQRKLMGTLLLVMMVPLLIFMLLSTHISRGAVESSEISSNISRMELSKSYIEDQLNWYDDFLFTALVDENLVPSITFIDNISASDVFNIQNYIKDKLFGLYSGDSNLLSVALVSYQDHRMYKVENNEFFIINTPSMQKVENKGVFFAVDPESKSFTFARNIYRFENQELVGQMVLEVSVAFMDHILENLQSNNGESIVLLDSNGVQIYTPNHSELTSDILPALISSTDNHYLNKNDDYYFYQEMMDGQLVLLKMVPKEVMMAGAVTIGRAGFIILLISALLTIVLSTVVSNKVAKPIVTLSRKMEEVDEHNFNVQIDTERSDEIGILNRKYKEMIDRIRELIEKDFKREIETRDAQFLALQSQINPHFLYNTLQVISGMAIKKSAKDIYEMTQKLSLMFRYITKNRDELVSIQDEVKHLNNYLYIQNVRFKDQISIQLFVDDEVNQALIPLLTLQPIVENSFKHGFESQVEKGIIKIDIQKVFDEIEVSIEDNGVGISIEELEELNRKLAQDTVIQDRSIGLKNVDTRLKLYFGKEYGLEVFSKKEEYTKVILRMPYKEEVNENEQIIDRR